MRCQDKTPIELSSVQEDQMDEQVDQQEMDEYTEDAEVAAQDTLLYSSKTKSIDELVYLRDLLNNLEKTNQAFC